MPFGQAESCRRSASTYAASHGYLSSLRTGCSARDSSSMGAGCGSRRCDLPRIGSVRDCARKDIVRASRSWPRRNSCRRGRSKCIVGPRLAKPPQGENDAQIRQEGAVQGQEGHARAQARNLEKRQVRQEGDEPQAGDRHRAVGSPQGRCEGTRKEILVQEGVDQKIHVKKNVGQEEIGQAHRIPRGGAARAATQVPGNSVAWGTRRG